jgi:hypothetical protein
VTRRTDLELLIDALKEQTGNQASRKELATLLNWEQEKVHRVALRGVAETASRRTRLDQLALPRDFACRELPLDMECWPFDWA